MQQTDWKSQLAGLQMPAEPSAWPPSPLAVILVLTLLLLLGVSITALVRRWRRGAWRRAALAELRQLQQTPDPQQLSRLLRRIARERFSPRHAALGDTAFAEFLSENPRANLPLELALQLASCAHRPTAALDSRQLDAAIRWVRAC